MHNESKLVKHRSHFKTQFRNVAANPKSDPIGFISVSTRCIIMFRMTFGITASEYFPVSLPLALQENIRQQSINKPKAPQQENPDHFSGLFTLHSEIRGPADATTGNKSLFFPSTQDGCLPPLQPLIASPRFGQPVPRCRAYGL